MPSRRASAAKSKANSEDAAAPRYHTKTYEKHTPAFKFMSGRLFSNIFIFLGAVVTAVYVERHFRAKGVTLASVDAHYADAEFVAKECASPMPATPCYTQQCGRFVLDDIISVEDVKALRTLASDIMQVSPGGSGGPTILDLHSGALSYKESFINVYPVLKKRDIAIADHPGFEVYRRTRERVQQQLEKAFAVSDLYLTKPTFFSRITNKTALTEHDEYWHDHVDRVTYGSFDYTCLLYLSTYSQHFEGGRFAFNDKDWTTQKHTMFVEPVKGRLSCFTSGLENSHRVEQVTAGTRMALTYGFTCKQAQSIADPSGDAATTDAAVPDHIEQPKTEA
eukprot:m.128676 g.128676  ORF g.128676 m.128676 type:complete len:336 (+) comp15836_c2_seq1:98-1105(+)